MTTDQCEIEKENEELKEFKLIERKVKIEPITEFTHRSKFHK